MFNEIEVTRMVAEIETHLWRKWHRPLKATEKLVLEAVLTNSTYKKVGEAHGYTESFLQNVGSKLFSALSEASGKIITKRNGKQALTLLAKAGTVPTTNGSESVVRVEIYVAGDRPKVISALGSNYETFIKPAMARYSPLFAQTLCRYLGKSTAPTSLAADFAENITTHIGQSAQSPLLTTLYTDTHALNGQTGADGWHLDVERYADLLKSLVCNNQYGCLLTTFSLKRLGNGRICEVDSDQSYTHRWISSDVPIGQVWSTLDSYLHKFP